MEREILFRGKRIDNGDWVYGDLIHNIDCVKVREKETDIRCFLANRIAESYAVIPETVGQFTGLKDINGKKIFEGDIVTCLSNYTDIIGHIVYGSDATFFIERKGLYGIGLNNAEDWLEVIGNIHDNEPACCIEWKRATYCPNCGRKLAEQYGKEDLEEEI